MKAKIRNIITGAIIGVESTTEHSTSSYDQAVWVDSEGHSYGSVDYGPEFGYELIEIMPDSDQGGVR